MRRARWLLALDHALGRHGLPPRTLGTDLLVPDYTDVLHRGLVEERDVPGAQVPATADPDAAAAAREPYLAERERVVASLDLHPLRPPPAVPERLYTVGRHFWSVWHRGFREVERYRVHHHLRQQVMRRVLDRIGDRTEIVVVAHSLGGLVALDLLAHLPPGTRVRRLVSIGSPAGWPSLHRGVREQATFPYDRIGSWVDLHSLSDLVPFRRGSVRVYPEAIDVVVPLPVLRHGAEFYLGTPVAGRVLADALR